MEALQVVHNAAASRFEAALPGGQTAVCDYHRVGGVLHLPHTYVPRAFEGRGIASRLVEAALQWARAERLKVVPSCSYVAAYMRRHPQTLDLLQR